MEHADSQFDLGRARQVEADEAVTAGAKLDREDIAATLAGDEDAFGRIIDRYQAEIGEQMWRFCRQRQIAEELIQEVFVEAYLSLPRFQGRSPLLHWLRRISTRVGYRYWKGEARQRALHEAACDRVRTTPDSGDDVDRQDASATVHAVLAQLPPRDRLVLTLVYLEELSMLEVAQRTGWSVTMVKVQAHRARQKLKKILERNPL